MKKAKYIFLLLPALFLLSAWKPGGKPGQPVVDRVIAIVGKEIVKESDMQNALVQIKAGGTKDSDSLRAAILDQLLLKKLLIAQAQHDSLTVSESEISSETDRRMRYFLQQFKSQDDFEKFYGKTVDAFKFELHDQVRDLLLAQKMQAKITDNISVSPSEVDAFYKSQPVDSIPFINSNVEVGQILLTPPVNPELKEYTRKSLDQLRQRILKGDIDFCTAAASYSQDPGSNRNCGKYENVRRGTFVPAFDAVCFSMKEGEISQVFETEYGFHIVQLLERRGEEVTIRHILFTIPTDPDYLKKTKARLDSVYNLIKMDSLTFCEAAAKFSDDKDSKYNCGLILNPQTGNSRIDVDMLGQIDPDPQFALQIDQMKVGDISKPEQTSTRDGHEAYRILWLKSRTEPHRADLKQDYQMIEDLAQQSKEAGILQDWVRKRLATTYIRISDDYKNLNFNYPWLEFSDKQGN